MDSPIQPQANGFITIFRFPHLTFLLAIINIIVFVSIHYYSVYSQRFDGDVFTCLSQEHPECLERKAYNQSKYIDCVSKQSMDGYLRPELCLYDVTNRCSKDQSIMRACVPYELRMISNFGFVPEKALSRLYTLFTSLFLHADWAHLINNLISLILIGSVVEAKVGKRKYLILYFLTGIGGSIFFSLFNFGSGIPAIGASGAIFGLMGAHLILNLYDTKNPNTLHLFGFNFYGFSNRIFVAAFLSQLMYPLLTTDSFIAFSAHIGGFITGAVLCLYLKPKDVITSV